MPGWRNAGSPTAEPTTMAVRSNSSADRPVGGSPQGVRLVLKVGIVLGDVAGGVTHQLGDDRGRQPSGERLGRPRVPVIVCRDRLDPQAAANAAEAFADAVAVPRQPMPCAE